MLSTYFGVRTYILGFEVIFWVSGLIFWVLDLYLGVWTSNLGVWTYTSGVRVGSGRPDRPGRAGGRVGWVQHLGGKSILGICIRKKVSIDYIIEFWTWGIFTKKTRAEKCCIFAVLSRRDLSYETDSGPKTKTDYLSRKSVQFLKRPLIYES